MRRIQFYFFNSFKKASLYYYILVIYIAAKTATVLMYDANMGETNNVLI